MKITRFLWSRTDRHCNSQQNLSSLIDDIPDPDGDTPDKAVGLFCPHCNRIYRQRDIAHLKALNRQRAEGSSRLSKTLTRLLPGFLIAGEILVILTLISLVLMACLPQPFWKLLFQSAGSVTVLELFVTSVLVAFRAYLMNSEH